MSLVIYTKDPGKQVEVTKTMPKPQLNELQTSSAVAQSKPDQSERHQEKTIPVEEIPSLDLVQSTEEVAKTDSPDFTIRSILNEVTLRKVEERLIPSSTTESTEKRVTLLETNMKHPYLIMEETGSFSGGQDAVIETVNAMVATHLLVKIKDGVQYNDLVLKLSELGCSVKEELGANQFIISLSSKEEPQIEDFQSKRDALENLEDLVSSVEPDYFVYAIKTPNDARMIELWGLHNSGQTGGTDDKDIDAHEAWDLSVGTRDVLVGVIDTGVDRNHEDLAANMWTNPNEIAGNGLDDDGNGFVDDVHGWDFYNNDNDPTDDNSHGTHCAGTIGGVGNNGKGVAGVNWEVSMVGIKFLGGSGGGYLSDAVKSITYATKIGVDLTSNSWGGGGYSSSMKTAIDEASLEGIGFIAAAGNHAGDNDAYPSYPASYESENVISVGAHNHFGESAYFSCFGKTSVDLFAPGVNTLSTIPGNGYASYSGTSMATPHVAGAYALILSLNPEWKSTQVKNALLENTDPEDSLVEKCLTGGRLNTFKALSNEPPQENLISASPVALDFGVINKGETKKLEFVLSNRGNAETTIHEVKILPQEENLPFEVSFSTPFVLLPNMAQTGSVSFSGSVEGQLEAVLQVSSDASNEPDLSIPLSAEVITTPDLLIEPSEVHFGLREGETQGQIIQLTNQGDGDLVYSISTTANSPWLTYETTENGVITPGQTVDLALQANASQMPGNFEEAIIEIVSNDPDSPVQNLRVTAERLSEEGGLVFRPSSVEFGNALVGRSSEKTIEMFNGGMDVISINRIAFENSAFSHFLDFPIILDSGEKFSATFYFTPLQEGNWNTKAMVFTDENGFSIRSLPITANATTAPRLIHNQDSISANLKMNQEAVVNFGLQNGGGSVLNWSLKGANGLAGSSFSLGTIFSAEHYQPITKGNNDSREGSPISTLGGGPDYHGYSWSDSTDDAGPEHTWTDISETGVLLEDLSGQDDGFAVISLPFGFELYGQTFSEVFVSSNGYLSLGSGSSEHGHFPLPTKMMAGNLIAGFATDLDPSSGGNIYYLQEGNGLTVQYDQVQDFAGLGIYTFQIKINAGGVIRFVYENMNGPIDRATSGIQNESGDIGLLVAYNNNQIQADSTVRISTSPKWLHTSKLEGQINSGESENVEITLKAGAIAAGTYEAILELSSNDPDQQTITIPVSLTIEEERTIELTPTAIDFGSVEVGLSKSEKVTILNSGNSAVSLESLDLNDAAFSSDFQKSFLQPGEALRITLTFKPDSGGAHSDSGTINSNAQNAPHVIQLSGQGVATPKLNISPEVLNVTIKAGTQKVENVVLDNYLGHAEGAFSVKEIRSKSQGSAAGKFNELETQSGEIIPENPFANEHAPNELIVGFKAGKSSFDNPSSQGEEFTVKRSLGAAMKPGSAGKALSGANMILIEVNNDIDLSDLASRLLEDPAVEYAEPNYVVRRSEVPNDPNFAEQWALNKIQAENAWNLAKGAESTIVAVIDTGIDYTHPDLQGNIWTNPGEIAGNGIDDDGNGYIDDVYGWDFINSDNDPMDGHNHGTHVAGTIAAATNNNTQVAGVAWYTKLVALKFLADGGWGYTSDAIDAIAYCAAMEIPISNNSWGGGGYSQALKDVISQAGDLGHLFCAAAGNSASDNDLDPHYPSNYDLANIISVAASDQQDELAYFSCYGSTTVDLAAPGTSILNLVPNGGLAYMSGTSMATPHVAGAAALLLSQNPSAKHQELKNLLMNSVDVVDSFQGKMVAPGRLNILKALELSSPDWLTVTPSSGSVPAGDHAILDFNINASNFVAGSKHAIVALETNDPLASIIEIAVNLTITGEPEIDVDQTALDFGELWVGNDKTLSLKVSNSGTDQLVVSEILLGHQAFSTNIQQLSLAPGAEELFEITVFPKSSGDVLSTLTLISNDPGQPKVSVNLSLKAITPPSLVYSPNTISVKLEPGETANNKIDISNSGEAAGAWDARIVELNVKRTRNLDLNQILSTLNDDQRSPDFFNPGHALFLKTNLNGNEEDSPNAVRYQGINQAGLEIGVLGGEATTELEDFGVGLSTLENVSGVTTINVSGLTPTLEEISGFDAIIVYSNYSYWDNLALGNLVSEYAATGGGVITMPGENLFFADSEDWSLAGEWRNNGLALFEMQSEFDREVHTLGEINLPNHPLVEGLNSFSGSLRILHQAPNQGGSVAASWMDGTPLITFRTEPNLVVDLNFFPTHGQWDQETDGWVMLKNAINWTTRSFTPNWLTGNPMSGVVNGNSAGSMDLVFDSSDLGEGNYSAEVQFSSNDPVNPFFAVEVLLEVQENQAPIASSKTLYLKEDGSLQFSLDAIDPDGDELTYLITNLPTSGSLEGENYHFTYTPAKNFNGADSLTFKVTDGRKESTLATVSFEIEAVNDAPWAQSFEVNATEDEFFTVDFKYGDIDGDTLNLNISKYPANGFLWEENGQWLYFPNNHFNGEDTFRYFVNDGLLDSTEATVLVRLKAQNDAPVAKNLEINTNEDSAVSFQLSASDIDNDTLTYRVVQDPIHGRLSQGREQYLYLHSIQ